MNNKKTILLLLLILSIVNITIAQDVSTFEAPYIKVYSRDDYKAHDQNWGIAQDSLGLIYVANNTALLIFDGEIWQKIKMQNVWGISKNKKGEIYFGADNLFGKIEYGKYGEIKPKSLIDQVDFKDRNSGLVIDIETIGDSTYFVAYRNVYLFYKDTFVASYKSKRRIIDAFVYHNKIYFTCSLVGLSEIKGNNVIISPTKHSDFLKLYSYKEGTIITSDSTLYYTRDKEIDLINGNFKSFDDKLAIEISNVRFNRSVLLSNDRIAFFSNQNGTLIYDLNTKNRTYINEYNGLGSNFVTSVFEDNHKNLWVSTYEGVNYVELSFPFRTINAGKSTSNIITSFTRTNNGEILYSTLSGIFKLKRAENSNQVFIHTYYKGRSFAGLVIYDNHIYSNNTMGVSEIFEDAYKQIIDFEIGYVFRKLEYDSTYMVLGGGGGLCILKYEDGTIKKVHSLRSCNVDTRYIVEDNGYMWFSLRKGMISRFKLEDIYKDSLHIEDFYHTDSTNINTIYINKICDKLIAQDIGVIKEFDYNTDKFKKVEECGGLNRFGNIELSMFDNNTNWLSNTDKLINIDCETGQLSKKYVFLKRVNNIKSQSIYNDVEDSIVWIGGSNKIGVIDKTKIDSNLYTFNVRIRNIRVNDSTIFYGYNLNDSIQRSFKRRNKFLFNFAAQYYRAVDENKYSYKLEGYDKDWSAWSDITFANYTNLDYGDYVFMVKAKNVFGKESKIERYVFTVEPDFHQTWYAKLLFIVFILLVIYLAIYLNGKRLKAINIKLEKQVEERTQEIKEQNKELEKLSIVASETDNSVMIYDENYNLEWLNDGEIRNFGYTLEEIYKVFGTKITELSFYPKINEVIKEIEETKKSVHYNSKGKRKDGSEIWSRTTLTPILDKKRKIKKIIAIDSDITELKHAEEKIISQNTLITQSLEYAKKIQEAVLPSLNNLKETFKDAFVIFQPKDIVSGDFFWMYTIGNKTIVATADCTGHGVPGGFMSMIGNTMMNEIVKEKNITSPSFILNLMDDKMNNLFKDSESGQADGMDVAIAVIDRTEGIIEVASANQSMYIVDDDEVFEFEGDMWSIGGVFSKKATGTFQTKVYTIGENTTLFMSSDGYQDQFGGKDDTKILKTKFIDLLSEISSKSSEEQEAKLYSFLKEWIGEGKQTDDILVIGIKL